MADKNLSWRWRAYDPATSEDGRHIEHTGVMNAANAELVRAHLAGNKGYIVRSVEPAKKSSREFTFSSISGKPSGKSMAVAYRQLAALAKANVPLPEAVAAVSEGTADPMVRNAFSELRDRMLDGTQIDAAMKESPNVFEPMTVQLIAAAREGGFMTKTLLRIADMVERRNSMKKKVRGAVMMPGIILVAAIGAAILISIVLVPQLALMLNKLSPGASLPLPTAILMWFSANALLIGIVVLALAIGWYLFNRFYLKHRPEWKRFKSVLMLRLPVAGKFTRMQAQARLSRGVESMLSSNVPLSQALEIISPTMGNVLYTESVDAMGSGILNGQPLSEVLATYPDLYDFIFVKMVATGEASGNLPDMMDNVANQKEEEVDAMAENMATLLNPLAIILVAFIVGGVALAMFSPILSIAQA